ncbi:CubicO group peptidase (beta-lactamase class C family) [Nonomuraea fuscirosea]|uniref:CubicO group peptidase (Beta-lactamase class C family) n=1 Tax=Nonomuraea fuscirosea TaxID=1291556 RepID=A0A2T0N4L0_9ACTN|nr:serine hydrolase domain-containing protein [Nonomuraea fuscirosea]PRX67312.1 CubicO group peptidase (beta-lactamase class C family) [Nonomuraea fuscirosea]
MAGAMGQRLPELIAEYEVPGAALAYLHEGELHEFAAGTLNKATGVDVTTDSLFQIGSVTKVYTATLIMQQIEQGRLTLDTPVLEVLPEFKVADAEVTKKVTIRHLLTHTSGIDGDLFLDTGRGDDCVEKYVAACADLAQNHPLGVTQSYCNSGFSIAGRVLEKLTGKRWDDVLREGIGEPLGLTHTWTLPEDVLRFRAAMGHVDGEPAPVWGLMRSAGPAGLICARPADVVAFARAHLEGGLLENPQVMWEPQVDIPNPYALGRHWGVGWIVDEWSGQRVISHGGNTIGQHAMLWAVPGTGTIACVTVNGGHSGAFTHRVATELFAELDGLSVPATLGPPETPVEVDASRYAGRYERAGAILDVSLRDGKPWLRMEATGALAELEKPQEFELVPVDETTFVLKSPEDPSWLSAVFYELPDGSPYVHLGARATPKTG